MRTGLELCVCTSRAIFDLASEKTTYVDNIGGS